MDWNYIIWLIVSALAGGAVAEFWLGPLLHKFVNGKLAKRKLKKEQKKQQQE